ncbi:MAG: aldo/keto reductase [Proteobacteria bacterium]|nr:aldo/keto reductase [Pseudomonadota bacterium]
MQYTEFQSLKLSRLGFGMMRLPVLADGSIDEPAVAQMVDDALKNGINYFDTAHPYHGGMSELVAGKVLSQYPRESYYLASKYPGHQYADTYNPAEIFEEQLKKCQVKYFDFYLLHNVCESSINVYLDKRWGIIDYFLEQKRLGRIKHLGFSAHGDYDNLKAFLNHCGEHMEFCQIQLNYLDWTLQEAEKRYNLLTERHIPVWVMEPVRGGRLAKLSENAENQLLSRRPKDSAASWAFRWLQRLPNVKVILSGMSNREQMADNIHTFSAEMPLTDEEAQLLLDIARDMHQLIPCTACRYCCDGCPQELDIPALLSACNDARFAPNIAVAMRMEALPKDKLPTACIACGACSRICPQHIDIPAIMQEFSGLLSTLPSWKKICQERAEAAKKLKK